MRAKRAPPPVRDLGSGVCTLATICGLRHHDRPISQAAYGSTCKRLTLPVPVTGMEHGKVGMAVSKQCNMHTCQVPQGDEVSAMYSHVLTPLACKSVTPATRHCFIAVQ